MNNITQKTTRQLLKLTRWTVKNTHRTRVAIVYKDQILLIQNWVGSGTYQLPGGGVKKNEDIKLGAARELKEELRLNISQNDLVHITTMPPTKEKPYYKEILKVTFKEKPPFKRNTKELKSAGWYPISQLPASTDDVTKQALKLI